MYCFSMASDTIWARVSFEDEMLESGALKLHWWRSLWVAHLRSQADKQHVEQNNIVES